MSKSVRLTCSDPFALLSNVIGRLAPAVNESLVVPLVKELTGSAADNHDLVVLNVHHAIVEFA